MVAGLATLGVGWLVAQTVLYVSTMLNRDRRGWHDKMAATVVVKAKRRPARPRAETPEGNTQKDVLWGGPGDDDLYGAAHDDQLHGGSGDDTLRGGAHDDRVCGGEGDDTLDGGGAATTTGCEVSSGTR